MKQAILIASVLLLFLVPAAAADVSILGGTVVVHTSGDVGVSALGEPLARVADDWDCITTSCVIVYGSPAGLAAYSAGVGYGSCGWSTCLAVGVGSDAGVGGGVVVAANSNPAGALVWVIAGPAGEYVIVQTDPPCVADFLVGDIVCST